jgi:hypothetical protein
MKETKSTTNAANRKPEEVICLCFTCGGKGFNRFLFFRLFCRDCMGRGLVKVYVDEIVTLGRATGNVTETFLRTHLGGKP